MYMCNIQILKGGGEYHLFLLCADINTCPLAKTLETLNVHVSTSPSIKVPFLWSFWSPFSLTMAWSPTMSYCQGRESVPLLNHEDKPTYK